MGNGFPGLAVFSAIALLVALGLAALLSLQPWRADSVGPDLSVAPGLSVGLGDSVAVPSGDARRQLAIAPARPAVAGTSSLVADEAPKDRNPGQPHLALAPARAVVSPSHAAAPEASPKPPPVESSPEPQPSPAPVAVPVVSPTPSPASEPVPSTSVPGTIGGHSPGPVGSGAGPGEGGATEAFEVHDGDERAISFSFYVESTAFRTPGDESLTMRFQGDGSESPSFGLQLWDDGSGTQRGLWASGNAMGGDRFLAPIEEGVWHEAVVCFQASNDGDGFYLLLLDGQPIDARAWVSLIDSGSSDTQVEVGLFREGQPVIGGADVLFGPTRFGDTLESVTP